MIDYDMKFLWNYFSRIFIVSSMSRIISAITKPESHDAHIDTDFWTILYIAFISNFTI